MRGEDRPHAVERVAPGRCRIACHGRGVSQNKKGEGVVEEKRGEWVGRSWTGGAEEPEKAKGGMRAMAMGVSRERSNLSARLSRATFAFQAVAFDGMCRCDCH